MITKALCKDLRISMLKEMAEIAKKYDFDVDFGNIRFTSEEFGVKMTARHTKAAPKVTIKPVLIGGSVKIGSLIAHPARKDMMEVVEVTARGSVVVVTPRGARYRLKMEDAKKYLAA